MKKWMMLLAGWLVLFGVINLIPLVMKSPPNMRGPQIALCIIAIVTAFMVFIDK